MVKKMTKSAAKNPSFDEYKSIKDEIISISELRYENLLNRKFEEFRKSFKKEIMDELNPKFEAIDAKFETKFEAINSTMSIIKWSIWSMPLFMAVILAVFTILIKKL
jgi:hypothetical protein